MPASEQILAVMAVFGLLGGALWAARRSGALHLLSGRNERGQAAFRVTHRIPLTAHHCLHVVEAGGTTLLVGTHPAGMVFAHPSSTFESDLKRACERDSGGAA
jgi:flagellar biogenesis protein FliO